MTEDCEGAGGQPYSVDVLESSTSKSCVDNGGGSSEKSFSTSSDSASSYHTAVIIFITVNYCCTMIVLTLASIDSHLKNYLCFCEEHPSKCIPCASIDVR